MVWLMVASDLHTYSIPGGPRAASQARAVVTEALAARCSDDRLADVRLLVSELITNGVRHGDAADEAETLTLRIAADATLHVDVIDQGKGFAPDAVARDPIGGWGLILVEQLADRWGVTRDGGTRVWFEMAV